MLRNSPLSPSRLFVLVLSFALIISIASAASAPAASFTSTNVSVVTNSTAQGWAGVAPFSMVFNDTSTNTPTSWKWGRNNLTVATWEQFSTTNNATQTFVAGNWSVNLTATNSGGSGISGITWVNVSAAPATWTSANGCWTATNGANTVVMWNATGTSSWTAPAGVTSVQYLVVAGGGSGGCYYGGGGGAGGLVQNSTSSLLPVSGTLSITVGTGGLGSSSGAGGNNGTNSSFSTVVAIGGGTGGFGNTVLASPGGSGGGGGGFGSITGGSATQPGSSSGGYGNAGGDGYTSKGAGGGGGGAGAGGGTATSSGVAGNGGIGLANGITGTLTYYAGGGGGGANTGQGGTSAGTGGSGGGGNGNIGGIGYAGTNGLGGGGGGGNQFNAGGNGGSGVVIISYTTPALLASFSSSNISLAINSTSQGWAGVAPFTMVFNDTSTNTPTLWKWGRNNLTVTAWEQFSTTNNATQAFVAGNWSVNLTATNSGGSGISGITWVNVSAATSAGAPVASFTGTPLSGSAPLAVTFTDTSTGTPTSWNWVFGDGNSSTIQSPAFTYVTSGYFTVKLTAANAFGSNAKTISQYISVAAVSRQNSTANANITQTTSGGQTNVNVSTCDPGMTVTNTTTQVLVTNPALGWQKYTFDGANITKNTCYVNISVSNVTMDSTPFTAGLSGILGTVSTSLIIGQNQTTSGTLQQEIIPGANTTVTNAFQLAATNNGLTLGNIAYTLQIGGAAPFNRNLTTSGVIINMSASHTWVLANGGTGAIKIFRYSDTGVVQMLPTTFVGTDAGSIDYFKATSVNGFSEFGLGGTSTTPGPGPGPSNGGGGDSENPGSVVTPKQLPETAKVNVGGNSAVTQVAITGTGISGAIVTGTIVSGPGQNNKPPSGNVYQYMDITPARYTTISNVVISFTVPVTWLTEHKLTPENVVMYPLVGQTWVSLPTTLVKVENGVAYYTAASPEFSRFAIAGQAGVTSGTPLATRTPAGQTYGDLAPATAAKISTTAAVAVRPVTTQTTAILAVSQPAPVLPIPTIAIAGGVIVVLVAGGLMTWRWWIRRQNPALFRNYD